MRTLTKMIVASLVLSVLSGCGGGDGVPEGPAVRLGVRPGEDVDATRASFAPTARALSEVLGVAVHVVPTESFDATLEAFTTGDITLAWLDEARAARAAEAVPGAMAIARGLRADGSFYIIAHRDTDLEWSDHFPDLLDRACAFGSRHSTAGYVMPLTVIREETGGEFRNPIHYATSPREVVEWVMAGKVDVGVVPDREYDELLVDGAVDVRTCRVIWKSPMYPNERFVVHPDVEIEFGPAFIDRLRTALVSLDDVAALKPFGLAGFRDVAS